MCLSSQQAAADVGEEDYPSLIKVNISHHSPDRMNLKHIGYRSIMGTRDVVCFNLICLFQWLNIKYLFQWLNINGLFQWLNIKFLFQWLNIECFFQWFDIKCLLQCLNIKCPIQCLNIKCLFEWLNIKCLFQWLNDSMTRCLFQELWRQFLEEKEGPSEAAAAAPVQVWLKKICVWCNKTNESEWKQKRHTCCSKKIYVFWFQWWRTGSERISHIDLTLLMGRLWDLNTLKQTNKLD